MEFLRMPKNRDSQQAAAKQWLREAADSALGLDPLAHPIRLLHGKAGNMLGYSKWFPSYDPSRPKHRRIQSLRSMYHWLFGFALLYLYI